MGMVKSRSQTRQTPFSLTKGMASVGQTSAQAPQPTHSSGGTGGNTSRYLPLSRKPSTHVERSSHTRTQRPHKMQSLGLSADTRELSLMPTYFRARSRN